MQTLLLLLAPYALLPAVSTQIYRAANSTSTCNPRWEFDCNAPAAQTPSSPCIPLSWRCDDELDCDTGADESNCASPTLHFESVTESSVDVVITPPPNDSPPITEYEIRYYKTSDSTTIEPKKITVPYPATENPTYVPLTQLETDTTYRVEVVAATTRGGDESKGKTVDGVVSTTTTTSGDETNETCRLTVSIDESTIDWNYECLDAPVHVFIAEVVRTTTPSYRRIVIGKEQPWSLSIDGMSLDTTTTTDDYSVRITAVTASTLVRSARYPVTSRGIKVEEVSSKAPLGLVIGIAVVGGVVAIVSTLLLCTFRLHQKSKAWDARKLSKVSVDDCRQESRV
ncbi:uncharacterized protein [Oscarella lobularis]|uniref:uncharacterized protein isoform X1 n=1 Tax=Oscarella lobularis TaxID=121494 RepID=UPI00331318A8